MIAVVTPHAFDDLYRACAWYGAHSDAAERIADRFDKFLVDAERFPFIYPAVYRKYRRARLSGFPYHVYYRIRDEFVVVVLVVHAHRDPRWIKRTLRDRT